MWFLAHTWPYAGFAVATKKSINHVTSQKLKHEPEADFANYIRMDHLQVVEPPSQTHRLTLTTNRQSLNMSLNNRVNLYETLLEVSPFLMSHRVVCWAKVAYVDEALLIWLLHDYFLFPSGLSTLLNSAQRAMHGEQISFTSQAVTKWSNSWQAPHLTDKVSWACLWYSPNYCG